MKLDSEISAPKKSWTEAFEGYLQPKMLAMLALGFGSGLPFMMLFSKLSRWLSDVGVDKATIGAFIFITLSYSFKFVWAPIVDRGQIPILTKWLGQRRSWMMLAVFGTIIGMAVIAFSDPKPGHLIILVIGAFITSYSGATLDIAVDAWRIESGTNDEQANLAAVYQLGYRFAIMAAAYAIIIADIRDWTSTYIATAGMMAVIAIVILVIKEPPKSDRLEPKSFGEAVQLNIVNPFFDIVSRLGRWFFPVFAFIILYRLSDFTMGVMTQPFYAELGYTKTQVGLVQGTFGPWPMIFGSFLGGLIVLRYGMMQALFYGAIFMIITNGAFAWLALQEGAVTWKLLVTIFADNVSLGVVGTAFIAYMSSIANRAYAATQYALMSSVWSLFNKTAAGFSGFLYEAVGSFQFFLITAAYGIPAILLLLYIWRYGSNLAKGLDNGESVKEAEVFR